MISSKGSTNFSQPEWRGFDIRGALETKLGLPVVYTNDANAAALYAHHLHFGAEAGGAPRSSAIVGTGLGGGVVESGRVVQGAAGMAGELGHVQIPMHGLLGRGPAAADLQLRLRRRRGERGLADRDREEPAPVLAEPLPGPPAAPGRAAAGGREEGARARPSAGDELALAVFEQQAMALGRLFTIAANFTDPDAYFLGGGVVEAAPHFRDWFLDRVRSTPSCARSRRRWPRSRWCRTGTWPAPAAPRSPPATPRRRQSRRRDQGSGGGTMPAATAVTPARLVQVSSPRAGPE